MAKGPQQLSASLLLQRDLQAELQLPLFLSPFCVRGSEGKAWRGGMMVGSKPASRSRDRLPKGAAERQREPTGPDSAERDVYPA